MAKALRTDGLTAGYDGTIVIDDGSFSLEANGGLALLGRNGVGKSTLISTLGHTQIRSGRIVLGPRHHGGADREFAPKPAWRWRSLLPIDIADAAEGRAARAVGWGGQ